MTIQYGSPSTTARDHGYSKAPELPQETLVVEPLPAPEGLLPQSISKPEVEEATSDNLSGNSNSSF